MELHDGAALAGEHPLHLMIAALGDFEPGFARAEDFEFRREAWLVLAFEYERAAREQLDEPGRKVGADGDFVEFWDFVFWRSPAMHDLTEIGEKQDACGVFVEPTDAGDWGIPLQPARREDVVNRRPFTFVVRADEPGGFVQKHEQSVRMFDGFTIHEHVRGHGFVARGFCRRAADEDTPRFQPCTRFTTRAVAKAREECIETELLHVASKEDARRNCPSY